MSGRAAVAAIADDGDDGTDGGRGKPKKAPNAFRTISEVADELHIPQHVLRFWETKFPQVKPLKRGGGRRYYRPDDIALLRRVSDLLYIQGYTIKGVQRLLREGGGKLSDDIPPAPPEEREEADVLAGHADQGGSEDDAPGFDAPELPMPGLTPPSPAQAATSTRRSPARTAMRSEDASTDPRATELAAEAAQLRAVLSHTLRELEALRALLP
jgi:DNA-binding transcriptional MerR regulator